MPPCCGFCCERASRRRSDSPLPTSRSAPSRFWHPAPRRLPEPGSRRERVAYSPLECEARLVGCAGCSSTHGVYLVCRPLAPASLMPGFQRGPILCLEAHSHPRPLLSHRSPIRNCKSYWLAQDAAAPPTPPWRYPRGESQFNHLQMPPDSGGMT